jgi:hypothetical protein
MPETPADRATPHVPPPTERRPPPVDLEDAPFTPVAMAQADLSRRLRVDIAWIEVVEVVSREPSAEDIRCLAGDSASEERWANLDKIQRITLSVKGNVHHYVALENLIIYCDG